VNRTASFVFEDLLHGYRFALHAGISLMLDEPSDARYLDDRVKRRSDLLRIALSEIACLSFGHRSRQPVHLEVFANRSQTAIVTSIRCACRSLRHPGLADHDL
jgi:hypothetical protein